MIIRLTTFLHWPVLWPDSEGDLISQNQQCGDGWVQRKSSNSCYFWNTNNLQTYAGAVQECNLMGADLLVINDDDEQVRTVQVLYRCCTSVMQVLFMCYVSVVQVVWRYCTGGMKVLKMYYKNVQQMLCRRTYLIKVQLVHVLQYLFVAQVLLFDI